MHSHPNIVAAVAGFIIIALVLLDAFETIVLPRRVSRHFRLTAWFYRRTWIPWRAVARRIRTFSRQQNFLGYFGPLSLLMLLGFWASGLILGFALLQYGIGAHEQLGNERLTFGKILYQSGETFFTLGYGDIVPTNAAARALSVLEAGMGFGFLGTVIGYLPVVYSSFSRREIQISMLDARAGSPPSASELLIRLAGQTEGPSIDQSVLDRVLRDWESWSAELLESHISYPGLSFFRSQHSNQSWLATLTTILDVTTIIMVGVDGIHPAQAKLTFAMARHAAVDLAQVVNAKYIPNVPDRLPEQELSKLRETLASAGIQMRSDEYARQKTAKLRRMYEAYVYSTAKNLMLTLPSWRHDERVHDNWQGAPWDAAIQAKALGETPQRARAEEDHF
jgi:Ion channel